MLSNKTYFAFTVIALMFALTACMPGATLNSTQTQPPSVTADTLSGQRADNTRGGDPTEEAASSAPPPAPGPDLRDQRYSLEEMEAISSQYPDVEFLFSFEIAGVPTDSTAEHLDLSGHTLNTPDEIGDYIPYMPNLTQVDMCGCGLTNEEMETLCSTYPDIKFVWTLTLGVWQLRTDAVAFSTLSSADNPVKLTSEQLDILKYCTDLVALDLGHHNITDLNWATPLSKLKILILACNNITDLTPLSQLKSLRYVELFENRAITDITPLAQLPHLQDLNLGSCFNIEDFTPLLEISSLERLWVNFTCITGKELSLFDQLLPDCKVCYLPDSGATDGGWRTHERYYAMRDMFENNYLHELFV